MVALKLRKHESFSTCLTVEWAKCKETCTSTSHCTNTCETLILSGFIKQEESQKCLRLNLCSAHRKHVVMMLAAYPFHPSSPQG